ncbi:hypothetical protein BU26DRAFT_499512 [Trematosphaeria pertusa]|uniref:Uncharacterized protein n=1 Tax=Trematosphaeria pertusa TaxID=390896 RepID=A0A6A6J3X8_9PLEO|nr:uncharacterized protein BU26DRAFT_499512 [Trematosphaeria pertusa]KAF2256912.1 hypothetical protein BU26DRAFT_499512 [Trematosphaeria pertusa]
MSPQSINGSAGVIMSMPKVLRGAGNWNSGHFTTSEMRAMAVQGKAKLQNGNSDEREIVQYSWTEAGASIMTVVERRFTVRHRQRATTCNPAIDKTPAFNVSSPHTPQKPNDSQRANYRWHNPFSWDRHHMARVARTPLNGRHRSPAAAEGIAYG